MQPLYIHMIMYCAVVACPKQVRFVAKQTKPPQLAVLRLTERAQLTENLGSCGGKF